MCVTLSLDLWVFLVCLSFVAICYIFLFAIFSWLHVVLMFFILQCLLLYDGICSGLSATCYNISYLVFMWLLYFIFFFWWLVVCIGILLSLSDCGSWIFWILYSYSLQLLSPCTPFVLLFIIFIIHFCNFIVWLCLCFIWSSISLASFVVFFFLVLAYGLWWSFLSWIYYILFIILWSIYSWFFYSLFRFSVSYWFCNSYCDWDSIVQSWGALFVGLVGAFCPFIIYNYNIFI